MMEATWKKELWFIYLLGHEACNIWSCLRRGAMSKFCITDNYTKIEVLEMLGLDNDKSLKRLEAFGLISINPNPNNYKIFTLKEIYPKYTLKSLCISIANAAYGIREFKKKQWHKIFNSNLDDEKNWSVAGETVDSISLGIVDKASIVIINENNIMVGEDQYSSIVDKKVDLIFNYEINNEKKPITNQLILKEITHVADKETEIDWRTVAVENWNSKHMADYICDLYENIFNNKPPYTATKLVRIGLKTSINTLYAKCNGLRKSSINETYKSFVNWIMNHKFYNPTINSFISNKIMDNYIIEITKKSKQKSLDPFNM